MYLSIYGLNQSSLTESARQPPRQNSRPTEERDRTETVLKRNETKSDTTSQQRQGSNTTRSSMHRAQNLPPHLYETPVLHNPDYVHVEQFDGSEQNTPASNVSDYVEAFDGFAETGPSHQLTCDKYVTLQQQSTRHYDIAGDLYVSNASTT